MKHDESIVTMSAHLGETRKYVKRNELIEARRSLGFLITEANTLYDLLVREFYANLPTVRQEVSAEPEGKQE